MVHLQQLLTIKKFEITSLRNDLITDGRHAKVQYTKNGPRMLLEEILP